MSSDWWRRVHDNRTPLAELELPGRADPVVFANLTTPLDWARAVAAEFTGDAVDRSLSRASDFGPYLTEDLQLAVEEEFPEDLGVCYARRSRTLLHERAWDAWAHAMRHGSSDPVARAAVHEAVHALLGDHLPLSCLDERTLSGHTFASPREWGLAERDALLRRSLDEILACWTRQRALREERLLASGEWEILDCWSGQYAFAFEGRSLSPDAPGVLSPATEPLGTILAEFSAARTPAGDRVLALVPAPLARWVSRARMTAAPKVDLRVASMGPHEDPEHRELLDRLLTAPPSSQQLTLACLLELTHPDASPFFAAAGAQHDRAASIWEGLSLALDLLAEVRT